MKKDEILEKSRRENKDCDLAEQECLKSAGVTSYCVGCCVCILICVVQWICTRTINWGCWVVNFSIMGTMFLLKFVKLRRRHELLMTILDFGLCAFFLIGFVMSLRG